MKLTVMSDLHGYLPKDIKRCDVVCICGDIMPLDIQSNYKDSLVWLEQIFLMWVDSLPCKKVILVAGNHDKVFDIKKYPGSHLDDFRKVGKVLKTCGKLKYLQDELYEYGGKTFYGTPWCSGELMSRWAFYSFDDHEMETIPDCDILLSHAPAQGKGGLIHDGYYAGEQCGSIMLRNRLMKGGIKYCFAGHIHSGRHDAEMIGDCECYNVSLMNEQYFEVYPPREIEIP